MNEPKSIKKSCDKEETKLRQLGKPIGNYLDFIKSNLSGIRQKPKFIRDLYYLSRKMNTALFIQYIERAIKYQIESIGSIERMSLQLLKNESGGNLENPNPSNYQNREAYQNGRFSEETTLDRFGKLLDTDHDK